MVRIQKLVKPNKHSGYLLAPGKMTSVRGMKIVNTNKFDVYIDKFKRPSVAKKKKKR